MSDPSLDDYSVETLEVLDAELSARLDRQDRSLSRIETKAMIVAGFAVTATQLVATSDVGFTPLAFLAYGGYAAAFAFGVAALAVKKHKDIQPRPFANEYVSSTKVAVLVRLISARVNHFEATAAILHGKAVLWWLAVATLPLGILGSIIAIGETR